MKSKTKIVWLAFVLISFFVVGAVGDQKAGWKGQVEEEEGVKVIKNPQNPLYGEIELELELDLSIGGDVADENYNFILISDVEVDDEGNIYVSDYRECHIQKYDKDGNYLQTIGRKGEGPGEFQRPGRMYFDQEGRLYVNEIRKIHIFDKSCVYERSIIPEFPLLSFGVTKEGNLLGQSYTFAEENRTMDVILVDPMGKKLEKRASFPDPSVTLSKGNIMVGGSPPYSPGLYFCPIGDELAIYGYSSEYRLSAAGPTGEVIYWIEKEEKREPTSKKEEDKYIKKRMEAQIGRGSIQWSEGDLRKLHKFAKYKPFFSSILTDDEGHIYLSKPKSVLEPEEDTFFDLFSKEGYYLYKVKIHKVNPRVIKNGCIYTSRTDPDAGYYLVERYTIKNWDQIKK